MKLLKTDGQWAVLCRMVRQAGFVSNVDGVIYEIAVILPESQWHNKYVIGKQNCLGSNSMPCWHSPSDSDLYVPSPSIFLLFFFSKLVSSSHFLELEDLEFFNAHSVAFDWICFLSRHVFSVFQNLYRISSTVKWSLSSIFLSPLIHCWFGKRGIETSGNQFMHLSYPQPGLSQSETDRYRFWKNWSKQFCQIQEGYRVGRFFFSQISR